MDEAFFFAIGSSTQPIRDWQREVETVRMDMVMDRVCMAMGVM